VGIKVINKFKKVERSSFKNPEKSGEWY